jgi:hypothetical protein
LKARHENPVSLGAGSDTRSVGWGCSIGLNVTVFVDGFGWLHSCLDYRSCGADETAQDKRVIALTGRKDGRNTAIESATEQAKEQNNNFAGVVMLTFIGILSAVLLITIALGSGHVLLNGKGRFIP